MLYLSEILIQGYDLESFNDLVRAVSENAGREVFFRIDVRPPFPDTPSNWEDVLESAFSGKSNKSPPPYPEG